MKGILSTFYNESSYSSIFYKDNPYHFLSIPEEAIRASQRQAAGASGHHRSSTRRSRHGGGHPDEEDDLDAAIAIRSSQRQQGGDMGGDTGKRKSSFRSHSLAVTCATFALATMTLHMMKQVAMTNQPTDVTVLRSTFCARTR